MTDFDPDALTHTLELLGLDHADKEHAARMLKLSLERLKDGHFLVVEGRSIDEKKARVALIPAVVTLADEYEAAVWAAARSGVLLDRHRTLIELKRTEQSNRRAEMSLR